MLRKQYQCQLYYEFYIEQETLLKKTFWQQSTETQQCERYVLVHTEHLTFEVYKHR